MPAKKKPSAAQLAARENFKNTHSVAGREKLAKKKTKKGK